MGTSFLWADTKVVTDEGVDTNDNPDLTLTTGLASGDYAVLTVSVNNTGDSLSASDVSGAGGGWSLLDGLDTVSTTLGTWVFGKAVNGSNDGQTVTVSLPTARRWTASLWVIRGSTGAPSILYLSSTANNGTMAIDGPTPGAADCLWCAVVHYRVAAATAAPWSGVSGGLWTNDDASYSSHATSPRFGVAVLHRQLSGQNGTPQSDATATWGTSNSNVKNSYSLLFTPAAEDYFGSGSLSGSGTLTASGTPAPAAAAALSGEGTLTASSTAATASGSAALSGSGSLSATGTPTASGAAALSGSGTLSATGSPAAAGAASLSGSGTLTTTGSPGASGAASLSGSGTLTATGRPTATGTAALSGSGTLSATGTPATAGAAALSGSGTLTAGGTPAIPGTAALSGTGTLTASGTAGGGNDFAGSATLSGSGTLTASGSPAASGSAALSGSGTLSAAGTPRPTGTAALSGSGTLTALSGLANLQAAAALSGVGTLQALGLPGLRGVGALAGEGTLTVVGDDHSGDQDITVDALLVRPHSAYLLPFPHLATLQVGDGAATTAVSNTARVVRDHQAKVQV